MTTICEKQWLQILLCSEGLLEQGITGVFFVTENFVDGACVSHFPSGTCKNTVTLQTGSNLVHTENL